MQENLGFDARVLNYDLVGVVVVGSRGEGARGGHLHPPPPPTSEIKTFSSMYSLLKFVYLAHQVLYSVVVHLC